MQEAAGHADEQQLPAVVALLGRELRSTSTDT
jgi:hypothetical protein